MVYPCSSHSFEMVHSKSFGKYWKKLWFIDVYLWSHGERWGNLYGERFWDGIKHENIYGYLRFIYGLSTILLFHGERWGLMIWFNYLRFKWQIAIFLYCRWFWVLFGWIVITYQPEMTGQFSTVAFVHHHSSDVTTCGCYNACNSMVQVRKIDIFLTDSRYITYSNLMWKSHMLILEETPANILLESIYWFSSGRTHDLHIKAFPT